MIERQTAKKINSNEIKSLTSEDIKLIFNEKHLVLSARASSASIEFLTHHIKKIEKVVRERIKIRKPFDCLLTIPGIGDILTLTIMLEVGNIKRFPKVGNFSSYARCVSSNRISNGKSKGKGNTKNGNRYLAWAYIEAAHFAKRFSPRIGRYFQRKAARTNAWQPRR